MLWHQRAILGELKTQDHKSDVYYSLLLSSLILKLVTVHC
jgi:hypothetical protein